jgi:diacylglycerol kinase (ATP)
MAAGFTSISIIYNPGSTGPGKQLATELKHELQVLLPTQSVRLIKTEYAGHAEELAYELARASAKSLVISSSGDGGYHEVVNGLLRAQDEGAMPIAGLLPAGNANDHYQSLHVGDTATAIYKQQVQTVDVLQLQTQQKGKKLQRYAHSYIGLGLTPTVGRELNKTELNRVNEVWIALRSLVQLRPTTIINRGHKRSYDSIICSNVSKMSKVLKLTKSPGTSHMRDGKFEVTAVPSRSKLQLLRYLLKASTVGLEGGHMAEQYKFKTIKPITLQLDGEICRIDGDSQVDITISKRVLRCIV